MKEYKNTKLGKYFVYVGNAYPHKNITRLLEAMRLFNVGKNEKVKLVIASARNVFIERLENAAKEKGVSSLVKILGFVPDKDLNKIYKSSIGFVYPTLMEGFGLPGLEAMKNKTLVLASNISVLKEIYEDNAIYFDPLDINSMVFAMETAEGLSSKEREKRIKKAQQFIKKYSWEKMAKETLKVYKSASEKK